MFLLKGLLVIGCLLIASAISAAFVVTAMIISAAKKENTPYISGGNKHPK